MVVHFEVCFRFGLTHGVENVDGTITGFLEDSAVLLGISLLAMRVLLFMQKFRDFLYMQSTEIAKQNKQQRLSSIVHNTHTTREERSR